MALSLDRGAFRKKSLAVLLWQLNNEVRRASSVNRYGSGQAFDRYLRSTDMMNAFELPVSPCTISCANRYGFAANFTITANSYDPYAGELIYVINVSAARPIQITGELWANDFQSRNQQTSIWH